MLKNTRYDLVCLGVTCFDILVQSVGPQVFDVDSTVVDTICTASGGDASNEAITAASLGMKTALVSCVGKDWQGEGLLSHFERRGVDTSGIEIIDQANSVTAIALIGDSGQRNFIFSRGCAAEYDGLNADWDTFLRTKILSIGSFFVMSELDRYGAEIILKKAKDRGVITVADATCDTLGVGLPGIQGALQHLDFFMPSLEEAEALTGQKAYSDMAKTLMDYGVDTVVIKLGPEGCYIHDGRNAETIPAFRDQRIVDTTGCGDSFVSGFNYGLLHKYSLHDCGVIANAVAVINAGYIGASGHIESIERIKEFLEAHNIDILR